MATFPIQFPDDWPDFTVTSHKRATGSHATGQAIDIAPIYPFDDKDQKYKKDSRFWFYYFHTFFALWAVQNHGLTMLAVPRVCPHLHLYNRQDINQVGVEWIQKQKGQCVPYYSKKVNKLDLIDSTRFRNFVENTIGSNSGKGEYLYAWKNVWRDLEGKFTGGKRWVTITSRFDTLPDAQLQALINSMYAGTASDRFLNEMSQIVGANSWQSLKSGIAGNVLLYGSLAAIGFYLYKENQKKGESNARSSNFATYRK